MVMGRRKESKYWKRALVQVLLLRYVAAFQPLRSSISFRPSVFGGRSRAHRYVATTSSPTALSVIVDEDEQVGAWIPIASINCLKGLGPQDITVMGLDLVVWEGNGGQWSVMMDSCPHRLAPLSQGRVEPETGCIECPYHGWQFDSDGNLTKIPQLDPDKNLEDLKGKGIGAATFPTHSAGDLLFAFLPSSVHGEMFPQSMLPETMFPTVKADMDNNVTYYSRDLPYSFDFLVENFMDPSHVPFAHHSLQSLRSDASPVPMKHVSMNFTHVETSFLDQSRGKPRDCVASFQRPTMYHFRKKDEKDGIYKTQLNIHCIPVKAGRSRVMYSSELFKSVPEWLRHLASNRFLNTDAWLHEAERRSRKISKSNLRYVHASESDTGVQAFRRWWNKHGFSTAPPNTFGAADYEDLVKLSRSQYIDPWEWHAKRCSVCRKALKQLKVVQACSLGVALAGAVLLRRRPIVASAVAGFGFWVRHMARKLATTIEGNPSISEISDRSPAHEEDYEKTNIYTKAAARRSPNW